MRYEHSLTAEAQARIDSYVERQTARAANGLESRQTEEALRAFLTDGSTLSTPGFILRRHLQEQGALPVLKDCPDLRRSGNVPWPGEAVHETAAWLSSISYSRHGLAISTVQWESYLSDIMSQGLQRDTVFKLAVVTCMGEGETLDLLMACGQAPYNLRRPLELICWFCQQTPGTYTWREVQRLLKDYESASAPEESGEGEEAEPETGGTTRLIRLEVEELLGKDLPAAQAEEKLLALMAAHCTRLDGHSRTARELYLRFLDYLQALYLPGGRGKLRRLIDTMFESKEWYFDDLFQTPTEARYVFRGELEDDFGPRVEECVLSRELGQLALFCKRYYSRASSIRRGTTEVDRRDVLLLGYFLITGYMGAGGKAREALRAMMGEGGVLDRRMRFLRPDLEDLGPDLDMKSRQVLCSRIFNELLAAFGFRPLYVPAIWERFFLLCLLTDRPDLTARYLLGEIVEE